MFKKVQQLVPNIVEANGKTIRQNNLEKLHTIPLGTLVEINCEYLNEHGTRQFVVRHSRDCDGTPLYDLSVDPDGFGFHVIADTGGDYQKMMELKLSKHWSADSLIVIKLPFRPNQT